jgi:hypothetical protein
MYNYCFNRRRRNMTTLLAALVLPLISHGAASPALQSKEYRDPGGAYTIQIPSNWHSERVPLDETITLTQFGDDNELGPKVDVITVNAGADLDPNRLDEVANELIGFVVQLLQSDGSVTSQRRSKTTFAGVQASRCDIAFADGDGNKFKGHMVVVMGKQHAILGAAYAPERDSGAYSRAEAALNTLTGPGLGAGGGAPVSRGMNIDRSALAGIAGKVKGGFQRDRLDTVLVPGDPPLTHGSVVHFVQLLNLVFDIELTETEFESTRQRFIEFYQKNDAEGKRILAMGGQQILSGFQSLSAQEQQSQKAEIRQALASRFEAGARSGIGYAQVLWEAIQRRSNTLKSVPANAKPATDKGEWDREFSEADLDSAIEMLYFMWVASGRDANLVTPEAVQQVRMMLIQNFDKFDPQFQLILANAQRIYSGLRGQYMQASPQERALLAQQYAQALDSLGLVVPQAGGGGGGGGGGSAWDDVQGYDSGKLRGELMMNSAFLSVNSWHR